MSHVVVQLITTNSGIAQVGSAVLTVKVKSVSRYHCVYHSGCLQLLEILEISWNLITLLEIPEIS